MSPSTSAGSIAAWSVGRTARADAAKSARTSRRHALNQAGVAKLRRPDRRQHCDGEVAARRPDDRWPGTSAGRPAVRSPYPTDRSEHDDPAGDRFGRRVPSATRETSAVRRRGPAVIRPARRRPPPSSRTRLAIGWCATSWTRKCHRRSRMRCRRRAAATTARHTSLVDSLAPQVGPHRGGKDGNRHHDRLCDRRQRTPTKCPRPSVPQLVRAAGTSRRSCRRASPAGTVTHEPSHATSPIVRVRCRRPRRVVRRWRTVPLASRHATIAAAVTGPTPGKVSNCSTVAVFRSTGSVGPERVSSTAPSIADAATAGRRGAHRTSHRRRCTRWGSDADHDLLAVGDLAGHVQPDEIRSVERSARGRQRIGDPRTRLERHQPWLLHQPDHAHDDRRVGYGGALGAGLADETICTGGSFAETTGGGSSRAG